VHRVVHHCTNEPIDHVLDSQRAVTEVGSERQERIGLFRQFQEHDVGPQLVEGTLDRAGGAGTVVPDAEEVNAHPVVSRDAM
jgi:hypothetical protein